MKTPSNDRILVLDDEEAVLDLLGEYLEFEGYQCTLATNAAEALDLRNDSFSLILTDLGLPDMNGLDVARRFREADPTIGVIVVTGITEVSAAIESLREGVDDYLVKPLNLKEFSAAVEKVLEKRRLVIENRRHHEELELRIAEATADLARANRELSDTKEYLENLLHSTVDAIITCDLSGKVTFVNDGAIALLGYERPQLENLSLADLLSNGGKEAERLWRSISKDKPLQNYESELKRRDGDSISVSLSLSLVRNADGEVCSLLAIGKDVTEQKRLDRELKEMSIKDSLTGLYNHRFFYDRLGEEVERARRQKHPLSLLVIDLDRFKWYNDKHGHLAGDAVLRGVGEVILDCTREHVDMGCRYGGDEFTTILPEADGQQACEIADRIRVQFASRGFDQMTMSIGVKEYDQDESIRKFIQEADMAMYEAKRLGGNQVRVCRVSSPMPDAPGPRESKTAAWKEPV
ncbi:MAG TPA: diguanylate cyclase [Candidatus Hydrogenedentes bacterium]|nr:diguanylate cyclase [Candidatus Hydrogenedentota bacterium]HPG66321.1 diguanylate cyclase [Candidatus Hydrogenedentota bacterium]